MIILLVRHGETDTNALGMNGIVGNNAPLNENGRVQVSNAAGIFKKYNPTKIYSSPFLRCQQTAEFISNTTSAGVEVSEGLKEFDMGDWANMKSEDTKTLLMQHNAWDYSSSKFSFRVPGGESWEDVTIRVKSLLNGLINTDDEAIVLVSHNATVRAFVGIMLGTHFKDWFGLPFQNGAISAFEYKNGHYTELFINMQVDTWPSED